MKTLLSILMKRDGSKPLSFKAMKQKMKRIGFILMLLLTTLSFGLLAQETREQRFERIRAVKIALITERVKLSSSQAEHFWPVYHRYETEFRTLRKANKENRDEIKFQEDLLNLRKSYRNEFLKIITEQQLQDLYDAEREFKKILLERLKDNPNRGGPLRKGGKR